MRICVVTHVCSDPNVSDASFESYRTLGYPVFWVCFNKAGLQHAAKHFSRARQDVVVDYSVAPFADLYLNEASYCFFRQFGPKIWSAFDVVAIPQDDVAYGQPGDLTEMARIMLGENIVLAMPSFFDGPNLTLPHVATQRHKGRLRRYSNFVEELGWIVNTQLMPLEYFTLAYCFSKSSWGKEYFLCANLINCFGPMSCAIFDQFPAHHLRAPLAKHGNMDANHLYRKLKARFGLVHPNESWRVICEKENYVCYAVELGFAGTDGKKRILQDCASPVYFAGTDRRTGIPLHPEYWLPRKYNSVASLRQLLENDREHIDYRALDALLVSGSPAPRAIMPISPNEFRARFGELDTAKALSGLTVPWDTQVILTLLNAAGPRAILEIGVAQGHMTANFSNWSSEGATVYGVGLTAEMQLGSAFQGHEDPGAKDFGKFVNHFQKGSKVKLFPADSLTFDFAQVAPVDFVFVDGAHDLAHVLSDSLKSYEVLNSGGFLVWHDFSSPTPWVEVRQALEQLPFAETIFHVQGTEVAFLQKR